jgi:uncharacterized membrane protein
MEGRSFNQPAANIANEYPGDNAEPRSGATRFAEAPSVLLGAATCEPVRKTITMSLSKAFDENNLHRVFEISLILKGIFALLEILAGIVAYFITQHFLLNLVLAVFHEELQGDPHDFIANFLIQSAQHFSVSTQLFTSFYLLGHGVIKAILIAGLLRGKLGYYPAAIVVFLLFVVYQIYRYSLTHSIWLLLITLLDIVVIWLTWHEYRYMREHRPVVSSARS